MEWLIIAMDPGQDIVSGDTMEFEQVILCNNIDLDGLRSVLDTPSAITQLENCKFLAGTPFCDEIKAILSDPVNASLDVSNRLIVGRQLACGAQADVYEGALLTSNVDLAAIRLMLEDKKLFDKQVKDKRLSFKRVAVKQRRVYTFLEDANKGAKVSGGIVQGARKLVDACVL